MKLYIPYKKMYESQSLYHMSSKAVPSTFLLLAVLLSGSPVYLELKEPVLDRQRINSGKFFLCLLTIH